MRGIYRDYIGILAGSSSSSSSSRFPSRGPHGQGPGPHAESHGP